MLTRTTSRRAASSEAGFSVIEIMGVVLVLAMIGSIVMVNWQALVPRAELNAAVRGIAATLQQSRSDAIARNAEFRVEYDLDMERYRVVTPYQPGGGLAARVEDRLALPWEKLPKGTEIQSVWIDGIEYRENPGPDGTVYVRFDPLGASSSHTVILFQPAFEAHYTIEVLALTGLIRFHEGVFFREPPDESEFE